MQYATMIDRGHMCILRQCSSRRLDLKGGGRLAFHTAAIFLCLPYPTRSNVIVPVCFVVAWRASFKERALHTHHLTHLILPRHRTPLLTLDPFPDWNSGLLPSLNANVQSKLLMAHITKVKKATGCQLWLSKINLSASPATRWVSLTGRGEAPNMARGEIENLFNRAEKVRNAGQRSLVIFFPNSFRQV